MGDSIKTYKRVLYVVYLQYSDVLVATINTKSVSAIKEQSAVCDNYRDKQRSHEDV